MTSSELGALFRDAPAKKPAPRKTPSVIELGDGRPMPKPPEAKPEDAAEPQGKDAKPAG